VVEAALAVHLAVGAAVAVERGAVVRAAFLALFAAGCVWVSAATAFDR
jgi:hypothetical protein